MYASPKSASPSWQGNVVPFKRSTGPQTCEVLVRGRWTPIGIDEALGLHPDRLKRCGECQGAVQIRKAADAGEASRFIHRRAHAGCSHSDTFGGKRARHPKPLA